MKAIAVEVEGPLVLEPRVFEDARGAFFESYHAARFAETIGREVAFVQDNHSHSRRDVLRGLHFQTGREQAKLVRVVSGAIWDVAVDLRRNSRTFGRHSAVVLSAENRRQLWIPEGFAHGFLVVSDSADVLYKTSDYWAPECECCLAWNDPDLSIPWPLGEREPILSEKDRRGRPFREIPTFG